MTSTSAINANETNYNAVKIKVNKPKTVIPEGYKNTINNGIYNAVSIEVDEPSVEIAKDSYKKIYDYPNAKEVVTYNVAGLEPIYIVDLPVPLAYQANLINNRTFIAADIALDEKNKEVKVPEPNVTTVQAEKASNIAFQGLSFKSNKVEIIPPANVEPEVNIEEIVQNLSGNNLDKQALQMEAIAKLAMEDSKNAIPYIVTEVFASLIDIVNKDTSALAAPTKQQMETRKQIIINEIVKEQSIAAGKKPNEIELPYKLSKEEMAIAANISPLEQAERNKEYALYTIAILDKIYINEVEKEIGNVIPLTDLPGTSEIVDELRYNENPSVKIAAIDALRYIARPEYSEELNSILTLASKDSNEYVARNAIIALQSIQK